MSSNRSAAPSQPVPARRRGRATAMVVVELGLDEPALEDALAWARLRVEELLGSLDDAELRALLEPTAGGRAAVGEEPIAAALDEVGSEVASSTEGDAAALEIEGIEEIEREGASERGEPGVVAADAREPGAAATMRPTAGPDRRVAPRYSLVEPAVVEVGSWSELVALYTKDISCGGMFVQTEVPPERDTTVAVQLLLPDGAGTLDFEGVVVHVVGPAQAEASGQAAGFGLQFSGLTAERRRALQRLIEQAEAASRGPKADGPTLQELGSTCAPSDGRGLRLSLSEAEVQQLQELRAELATLTSLGDLQVLGLHAAADLDELRDAFERLARRWHPSVAHRDAAPEIRRLATEIFLRIEQAYRRLREVPRATGPVPPPPPFASASRSARGQASEAGAPVEITTPPEPEPDPRLEEVRAQQRARRARRLLGNLVGRSERLTTQLERREPAAAPPRSEHRTRVDEALRLLADKRYAEAAERLEQALRRKPDQRLRVLLCVVQARQALTERDFSQARARYEAVLQIDPDNEVAQRELLMLTALQR